MELVDVRRSYQGDFGHCIVAAVGARFDSLISNDRVP